LFRSQTPALKVLTTIALEREQRSQLCYGVKTFSVKPRTPSFTYGFHHRVVSKALRYYYCTTATRCWSNEDNYQESWRLLATF